MNNGETASVRMKTAFRPRRLRRWLLVLILLLLPPAEYARTGQDHPHILILNSYHQGEAWTDSEITGIFSVVTQIFLVSSRP